MWWWILDLLRLISCGLKKRREFKDCINKKLLLIDWMPILSDSIQCIQILTKNKRRFFRDENIKRIFCIVRPVSSEEVRVVEKRDSDVLRDLNQFLRSSVTNNFEWSSDKEWCY